MTDAIGGHYDIVVIGAGPAGLSAGLNLVRARRSVLLLDSNRPRNAATLHSHGFLTRDGISPLELRRLGREELERYESAEVGSAVVTSLERSGGEFVVSARGVRGSADREVIATAVVVAGGLSETLPPLPSLRVHYGTAMHSCMECDGFEKSGQALALIGETDDLAERALLLSQWSTDLIIFTNGVGVVSDADETLLGSLGVRVERRVIADLVGERDTMTGVALADGEVVARSGGFVRPLWTPVLDYLAPVAPELDSDGFVRVDSVGRTSVPGLYAAGDIAAPGPQQLIVAAGSGAQVASAVNRDLVRARLGEAAPEGWPSSAPI
ncbi:NAD(P)/FAD-dependent oxidoreductase [Rathayibacter toxicus]|uniref:NAD(P)/FAD-dependent oxidoreductase n=1 Tax=Rathayibacter toxicus TaxID=145458 RepID=A0A0U1PV16_9MICO|nr:NAD(P)/FAD-dependent oxidoreductase [Rathayibacter toxicus]ALS56729.1 pyridine nucleotide-disulfide oxidoreductase [Rathayibacter toxicus]KKM46749.1 pyridine nucleotide-disulfide oxidoreductase [Rathayibacter toxicus]PPG22485.1 NAD(P)/FAD-dependent oxidoreductase [Rathayibacter toxicus]PPG47205.1 NAD(P)/FAD-dependent oxidoreductase [Rathayibacter toxicus]PPH24463.1 NAD(P)/FAD-dependent oxidoreductase [Rathayibacter toxicus]